MKLSFISTDHALYADELELRFRVLREPLGHTREQVAFPFERESLHLVAHSGGRVHGCVLFHPEDSEGGRLFQMAVATQGKGLGAQLVRTLEAALRHRGFSHVHMHARDSALGFYQKLGYAIHGEPFFEVGVLHYHMARTLS
ncbi:MAG TPA: GNAT family N-acetyltransferase [Polyangiales bacterium]|nr:GNAT family N-acetyltransferase [Polyangiales bacterium]